MQREELAAAVYAEVLHRLEGQQADVAIGGPWPGWQPFAGQTAERTNRALVVQLAPQALARLAQGQAQEAEEVFLLEMLLMAKPVLLAPGALVYHRYRQSAPGPLYQRYVAAEEALRQMGVRPLTEASHAQERGSRRLLDDAWAQRMVERGEQTVVVAHDAIVTPLAADTLRQGRVTLIREE